MKRVLIIILTVIFVFSLCACSNTTQVEETDEPDNYEIIASYLEGECTEVFSQYYEILDFKISNYQEEEVNENFEATFLYTMTYKNYDRDPDTVGYIKEAKQSNNSNYQQMYDEYLEPKEMNFEFKVVIDKNDTITLYSNVAPKGIEWEETKISDYILCEN